MISNRQKFRYQEIFLMKSEKSYWQRQKERAIEHFNEVIHDGERSKVYELERTAEGDTQIRKIRL